MIPVSQRFSLAGLSRDHSAYPPRRRAFLSFLLSFLFIAIPLFALLYTRASLRRRGPTYERESQRYLYNPPTHQHTRIPLVRLLVRDPADETRVLRSLCINRCRNYVRSSRQRERERERFQEWNLIYRVLNVFITGNVLNLVFGAHVSNYGLPIIGLLIISSD